MVSLTIYSLAMFHFPIIILIILILTIIISFMFFVVILYFCIISFAKNIYSLINLSKFIYSWLV
jgi:hypothetical protein